MLLLFAIFVNFNVFVKLRDKVEGGPRLYVGNAKSRFGSSGVVMYRGNYCKNYCVSIKSASRSTEQDIHTTNSHLTQPLITQSCCTLQRNRDFTASLAWASTPMTR
jgi:hypothetical protein